MRSHSHLNTAAGIIHSYKGEMPLAAWLKQFFREQKKFGSKDRKQIAALCYAYYRLGNSFRQLPVEERILTALFLTSAGPQFVLEELKPEWNTLVEKNIAHKLQLLNAESEVSSIFPFPHELSKEIDAPAFQSSFLLQPDLFLRLRPGQGEAVRRNLQDAGIPFFSDTTETLRLPNTTRVEDVLAIDRDAVIQDLSSQRVLELLEARPGEKRSFSVWDCCAASGGKSILVADRFPGARLTVSDVRKSILVNLENRFARAGIKGYRQFVEDISSPHFHIKEKFDLVICDAPCSGSGTWGRTPEQLAFFTEEKIAHYEDLQKKIAVAAGKGVKKGGYLLYITCSVFRRENEAVVDYIAAGGLQLCAMQYLKGYDKKADTLFAALFTV